MFYIKEIYYRLIYLFICFFILSIVVTYFQEDIQFVFLLSLIEVHFYSNVLLYEISFNYANPNEFINLVIKSVLFISFFFIIPIWLVHLNLTFNLLNTLSKKNISVLYFLYFFFNYFIIFNLTPLLWYYIEEINKFFIEQSFINMEYEPNLLNYLTFFFNIFITFNLFLIILSLIFIYIMQLKVKTYSIYLKSFHCFWTLNILLILISGSFNLTIIIFTPLLTFLYFFLLKFVKFLLVLNFQRFHFLR